MNDARKSDWEIVAAIEEDADSEELVFNSADYATKEEAMVVLHSFIHEIFEVMKHDFASLPEARVLLTFRSQRIFDLAGEGLQEE